MSLFVYANNVSTTLAADISASDTTITLSSSANLPTLAAGEVFPITLTNSTRTVYEICYATAISGASLTVVRGREGTTAGAWSTGTFAFSAQTAAGQNLGASATVTVFTLADLNAFIPEYDGQVIYFKDATAIHNAPGGRKGKFSVFLPGGEYTAAQLTAFVTADSQGGIWRAVNGDATGASGAVKRIWDGSRYNLLWFGADKTGAQPSADALQAYFNILDNTAGTNAQNHPGLYAPAGSYVLDKTVSTPNSLSHFMIEGDGMYSTLFKWSGAAGAPMVRMINTRTPQLRNLGFFGNTSELPSYCLESNVGANRVGSPAPSAGRCINVFFGIDIGDGVDTGVGFTCDSGYDDNNDNWRFDRCVFANCKNYAVRPEHYNSLEHELHGCSFVTCATGVSNKPSANSLHSDAGGSFTLFGCAFGGCTNVMELYGSPHAIAFYGTQAENNSNLLSMPVTATETTPLHLLLSGMSWSGDGASPIVFDAGNYSTLDIDGGSFQSSKSGGGAEWSFPTTGSRVTMRGGATNIGEFSFNNEVVFRDVYISAGSTSWTNLGSGTLNLTDRSTGTNEVDTIKQFTSGTSIDINGVSSHVIGMNYSSATTVSTMAGGLVGDVYILYFYNSNVTLSHGTGSENFRLSGSVNYNPPAGTRITFARMDATAGNSWIEMSRTSR